jgi:2-hydroxychromene-2-carboxylate isomerase
MRIQWAEGKNIAEADVLAEVAKRINLDVSSLLSASTDANNLATLEQNSRDAENLGIIGVPTILIDDQIFWGQDRFDFVIEYLKELRASKL